MINNCENTKKKKVLIITGGHPFDREAFFEIFNSFHDLEYEEVMQPDANDLYGSSKIDKYDVLVFYDMFEKINESQKTDFINLLNQGKAVVFLHHALASYQHWHEFANIIGGKFFIPEYFPETGSTYKHDVNVFVQVVDKNHPITKGLENFMIKDEIYGKIKMLENVHTLLKTDHPESSEQIAWINQFGNSQIVYIQLGHDQQAYKDVNFKKIIYQSIKWAIQNN